MEIPIYFKTVNQNNIICKLTYLISFSEVLKAFRLGMFRAVLVLGRFLGRKRMSTYQTPVPPLTVCELHPLLSKLDAEGIGFLAVE